MGTEEAGLGTAEDANFEDYGSPDQLGGGAQFWAYISGQNNTPEIVKDWVVTISQGNWQGSISSKDPRQMLTTPGLSGEFKVQVAWTQPPKEVVVDLQPLPGTNPDVGCNDNCAAMVGIVANKAGNDANYWTVSDAYCNQGAGGGS